MEMVEIRTFSNNSGITNFDMIINTSEISELIITTKENCIIDEIYFSIDKENWCMDSKNDSLFPSKIYQINDNTYEILTIDFNYIQIKGKNFACIIQSLK